MTGYEIRERGLFPAEVEQSRRAHGANVFRSAPRIGFVRRFFSNLGDPVIKVLLAALIINLLLLFRSRDWFETIGIAVSVFLATLISTLSEYGSEAAFARLCEACAATVCRVRRSGIREIPVADVVVGDTVLLCAGERIPADGIIFRGEVTVDQSALTGESREAEKHPASGKMGDPSSPESLFAGCTVLSGEGEMEVTAVGDATYLGGISGELQQEKRDSPLKIRLTRLAGQISRIGYAAAILCALAFLFHSVVIDAAFVPGQILSRLRDLRFMADLLLRALMLGLTVVVVAVPEGLPMMIAVVLSSNIRRMIKDQVLVRNPAGLEAAGSMNILFTDKTGTLTEGKMKLCEFCTVSGDFRNAAQLSRRSPALYSAVSLAAHCVSGAERGFSGEVPAAIGGNSTDRALITAFLGEKAPTYTLRRRIPFDSARKYAVAETTDGRFFVMGAPEKLMPRILYACDAAGKKTFFDRSAFFPHIRKKMEEGERALFLCEANGILPDGTPEGLTLLCAAFFSDALRPEAEKAVRTLQGAGIQVVMITGDSKETAARIATACGILRKGDFCLSGSELSALSDEELLARLPRLAVVARALPVHKSRLVRLAEQAGLVVGMTGDGINDAPALKSADVGFAMGSGTQVAREAGDIVILDDNLSSVTRAVLYGRTIFKSIRKFITLQLVMNFCAVGISMIGPFIGFDSPVTVVQMLWINLIMDTLGGLAFAGEAPMPLYMKEPPKKREEPILTRSIVGRITFLSVFTVALSVVFLKSPRIVSRFRVTPDNLCLLTAFFALFIFAGVFNCFNARTDRVRMLAGIARNPAFLLITGLVASVQIAFVYLGGTVLRTMPLTPRELLVTLLLAFSVIPAGFLHLLFRRLSGKSGLY